MMTTWWSLPLATQLILAAAAALGLGAVLALGLSLLGMAGRQSDLQRQERPLPPAWGPPCYLCGVLESAHGRIIGHPFRVGPE